ncbi:13328_t:CDS:2 [Entrophospora sp. SA101]|nr:13328_t:CDS:2 [Entrophospora sp. SA101]
MNISYIKWKKYVRILKSMEIRTIMKYFKVDIDVSYNRQDTILIAKIVNKSQQLTSKGVG